VGRGELQRTIKRVLEERVQGSPATRSIRDHEKTALISGFCTWISIAFFKVGLCWRVFLSGVEHTSNIPEDGSVA